MYKFCKSSELILLNKSIPPKLISNNLKIKRNLRYSVTKFDEDDVDLGSSRDELTESKCYIDNGLRKVYPYYYKYRLNCRSHFTDKSILKHIEYFSKEPKEEIIEKILEGKFRVKGKIVKPDYQLNSHDFIESYSHRHELPILPFQIQVIYKDNNFLVIDKPPSIPVHTCNAYRFNTTLGILGKDYGYNSLHCLHRIDRLTSGVLMFAFNKDTAAQIQNNFKGNYLNKEYICRVEGNFPNGITECNKPIIRLTKETSVNLASDFGKVCLTKFKKFNYNGKTSTVLCKPITGRMHQIRVHLQYLGYPIVNDTMYNNSDIFGVTKGRYSNYNPNNLYMKNEIIDRVRKSVEKIKTEIYEKSQDEIATKAMKHYFENGLAKLDSFEEDKLQLDKNCDICLSNQSDPQIASLFMYLHAFRLNIGDKVFETRMPVWARTDWEH